MILAFPSLYHVQNFLKLKTVVLDNILSENLLNYLSTLPNIGSLIINLIDSKSARYINFHSIICLPRLKYCKISYQEQILFKFSDDHIINTSPIEHLVINGKLAIDHLLPIVSHLPHLSRLSFKKKTHS